MGLRSDTLAKRAARSGPSDPRVFQIEECWCATLADLDLVPFAFTPKQRNFLAAALARLRDEVTFRPAVKYCLHHWDEFSTTAAEAEGLRVYPKRPQVEFFVANFGVAIEFASKKHAEVEARNAPIRLAQEKQAAEQAEIDAFYEMFRPCTTKVKRPKFLKKLKSGGAATRAAAKPKVVKPYHPLDPESYPSFATSDATHTGAAGD